MDWRRCRLLLAVQSLCTRGWFDVVSPAVFLYTDIYMCNEACGNETSEIEMLATAASDELNQIFIGTWLQFHCHSPSAAAAAYRSVALVLYCCSFRKLCCAANESMPLCFVMLISPYLRLLLAAIYSVCYAPRRGVSHT